MLTAWTSLSTSPESDTRLRRDRLLTNAKTATTRRRGVVRRPAVLLLVTAILLGAGCVRRLHSAPEANCVLEPGTEFFRWQRLAVSRTMTSDSGQLVVTVAAGDSAAAAVEGASIRVAVPAGRPGGDSRYLWMQPTGVVGSYSAVLAPGTVALLVQRITYGAHRDTVVVRAGYSDTLGLRLRPCVGPALSDTPPASP